MSLLDEMSRGVGIGIHDLNKIIATAPKRYKVYQIAKRNGGLRTIAQPSFELKLLQRFLISSKLSGFPVHRSATAYKERSSIVKNASAHRRNDVILKLDFKDFFPSIRVRDWKALLKKNSEQVMSDDDQSICARILFWGSGRPDPYCLSIGAPSSPILSNIFMYDLDVACFASAKNEGVRYTRYADDITLSGESVEGVLRAEKAIRTSIAQCKTPKLQFNDTKRGMYLRGQRRMVTGLVITPERTISIGRDRKRLISAMMHRSTLGQLAPPDMSRLKGFIAFALDAEPDFVTRLRAKYGDRAIDRVLAFDPPRRAVK